MFDHRSEREREIGRKGRRIERSERRRCLDGTEERRKRKEDEDGGAFCHPVLIKEIGIPVPHRGKKVENT